MILVAETRRQETHVHSSESDGVTRLHTEPSSLALLENMVHRMLNYPLWLLR